MSILQKLMIQFINALKTFNNEDVVIIGDAFTIDKKRNDEFEVL